ncbi:MAG: hypothetical protein A2Y38_08905 [Spirochaetes bacterium GWB1_59_5]|nr:MAG: hypothetical protein A2Y38_08905 [Spirochaetes bacterium GWB1_59_5]
MLALPRIAAVQNGVGASNRAARSGKPLAAVNESFVKLLAGLRSAKAEAAPNANADTVPMRASAAKNTRLETRKAVDGRSVKGENPIDQQAQANRTGANPEANRLAVSSAIPLAKAPATTAALSDENAVAKPEKPRAGTTAAEGIDVSVIAAATRAATLSAADKGVALRSQAGNSGLGARDERERAGIEMVGTRTETDRNGTKLTVIDMRMKAALDAAAKQGASRSRPEGESSADTLKGDVIRADADSSFAGRLVARTGGETDKTVVLAKESPAASAQSFSEALASRLQTGASDIVRSAQIVLQHGDSGIIRLRLDPESLGGVKIELKMTEKQISGKIIVESDIAGEAFRSSLDALKDAFAESGFETTALEVEVRNDMASGTDSGNGNGARGDDDGPFWSRSLRELDAAVPVLASAGRDGLLDVFV